MSSQATVRNEELTQPIVREAEVEATTKPISLDAVVCRIREDSQQAPQDYLEECHVPHGGE